jgi:hypothetical protein
VDARRVFFRRATLHMLGLVDDAHSAVHLQAHAWLSASLVDLPMVSPWGHVDPALARALHLT